jgi:uncharacterized protein YecT (DUF1311 family)
VELPSKTVGSCDDSSKKETSMKTSSRLAFLLPIALCVAITACSKIEYDYKALGFADSAAMESAFAKGYQTKQKLDEMTPKVAASPTVPTPIEADISKFIEQRSTCEHFIGEQEPTEDAQRRAEVEKAIKDSCMGTDKDLTALRNKYASNAEAIAKLKDYELSIEPNWALFDKTAINNDPFAPSFDCQKASNGAERLVCSDRELAKLDVNLNQIYIKARDLTDDKEKLKNEQNEWIKSSRNACSDKNCMTNAFKQRISELSK